VDRFSVDVAEVRRAEKRLRELGESLASAPGLKYSVDPEKVGNVELTRALTEFHESSRRSTDDLCALAEDTARRLADTADGYLLGDHTAGDDMDVR
jgi:hypothetical protein